MPASWALSAVAVIFTSRRAAVLQNFGMNLKTRLLGWEKHAQWPLAAIALVFLVDYTVDVLARPQGTSRTVVQLIEWTIVAAFAVDYLVRLVLADDRPKWFVRHLFDLITVTLPWFRPLRFLRLVVLVSALQRAAGNAIRGRILIYAVGASLLAVYVASLAVLDYERENPASGIQSFYTALWWSTSTITTMGYGDVAPITLGGRVVAVGLMICAIGLVGSITATFASWIVQRVDDEDTSTETVTDSHVDALRAEIRALAHEVRANAPCKLSA